VVSDCELVSGVPPPRDNELHDLLLLLLGFFAGCEAFPGAAVLADFEGEFLGHGGELTTAQLQPTAVLNGETLVPRNEPYSMSASATTGSPRALGFLLDLRCPSIVQVLREIIQSRKITKLMWGASRDVESLMYQKVRIPMQMRPRGILDCQMAHTVGSGSLRRKGMARALNELAPRVSQQLPEKDQISWVTYQSQNLRAFEPPLDVKRAAYAMDDLHRLEVILAHGSITRREFSAARSATKRLLKAIRGDPLGLQPLKEESHRYDRFSRHHDKRLAQAVKLMRHVHAIRSQRRAAELDAEAKQLVASVESKVQSALAHENVTVPADLSFIGDQQRSGPP